MVAIVIITLIAAVVSEIATASRQIWSFARDDGLPFSPWLRKVRRCFSSPSPLLLFSFVLTSHFPLKRLPLLKHHYCHPAHPSPGITQVSPGWNIPLNAILSFLPLRRRHRAHQPWLLRRP